MSNITSPWKRQKKKRKFRQKASPSRQSHPFVAEDPDAVVGQFHHLPVKNFSDYGVYLCFGRDRVLLPNKYVPKEIRKGNKIRVFVYTDSQDRPVATTLAPAGVVGDIVALRVKATAPFGIFMDWGLEKDLLVPRSQQQSRMTVGETHLVKICLDESSSRIYGSTLTTSLCSGEHLNLEYGEKVDLVIHSITPIGYTALINTALVGMLYKNETFEELAVGDRCQGYVLKVRGDGKVDLSLKPPGYASVEGSSKTIMAVLHENGGVSPCCDKSSPEQIKQVFAMSKKEFKRAVGHLYKQGRIKLDKTKGIRLK
ncbi:MAG: hypothetical protein CSA29_03250 [Desulfobacterales bacterium]|nr:MAG: hypothetical protein CSA29_03250 [Desulfobacterales bacterium]